MYFIVRVNQVDWDKIEESLNVAVTNEVGEIVLRPSASLYSLKDHWDNGYIVMLISNHQKSIAFLVLQEQEWIDCFLICRRDYKHTDKPLQ